MGNTLYYDVFKFNALLHCVVTPHNVLVNSLQVGNHNLSIFLLPSFGPKHVGFFIWGSYGSF